MTRALPALGVALFLAAGAVSGAVAQTPPQPPASAPPARDNSTGDNKPAPTMPGDPTGNIGRPGGSSSSVNTPSSGEPTGTGTPQVDKKADTSSTLPATSR